jgi:hypothetical protein
MQYLLVNNRIDGNDRFQSGNCSLGCTLLDENSGLINFSGAGCLGMAAITGGYTLLYADLLMVFIFLQIFFSCGMFFCYRV